MNKQSIAQHCIKAKRHRKNEQNAPFEIKGRAKKMSIYAAQLPEEGVGRKGMIFCANSGMEMVCSQNLRDH